MDFQLQQVALSYAALSSEHGSIKRFQQRRPKTHCESKKRSTLVLGIFTR